MDHLPQGGAVDEEGEQHEAGREHGDEALYLMREQWVFGDG